MMIQKNDVILFQGDSITNAFRKPEEINDAYQLGAGYALMCAAHVRARRAGDDIRFLNRGVSGDTVDKLSARWQADCIALRPTVVSILNGINNAISATPLPDFQNNYRSLLQMTREELPGVRLILCEPFALPCGLIDASGVERMRTTLSGVRSLAAEFDALFVPLQQHFENATRKAPAEYWIYDGIHPTAAGHRLIADAWLVATEQL